MTDPSGIAVEILNPLSIFNFTSAYFFSINFHLITLKEKKICRKSVMRSTQEML